RAKGVLRNLAAATLDPTQKVRIAAANSMKSIDEHIAGLAVKLILNLEEINFDEIQKQGADVVEPLIPILVHQYEAIVSPRPAKAIPIAKAQLILNCLFSCAPDDPATNKVILKA